MNLCGLLAASVFHQLALAMALTIQVVKRVGGGEKNCGSDNHGTQKGRCETVGGCGNGWSRGGGRHRAFQDGTGGKHLVGAAILGGER